MSSSSNTIECPKCQTKIEISKAMTAQIGDRVRQELEAEFDTRNAALEKDAQKLAKQKAAVDAAQASIAEQIEAGIEASRAAVEAAARKKAKEDLAVEIQSRDERVQELEGKLKTAQRDELALRKRERELKDKTEAMQLEVVQLVGEATDKAKAEAKKQAAQEQEIKDAEKQEQMASMKRQIDDLKRQIEQGPQQRQGEALEVLVEDALARAFPHDTVEPISKGVNGADILQRVVDTSGLECGSIYWETKNAKKWSTTWIAKLKTDQREAKAEIAVLVTESMPDGCQHMTEVDGVWVCTRACAVTLGAALRTGLVELAKSRQAADGKHGKIEQVYHYLSGNEFRQRIAGMVEPLIELQSGISKHRRAMERVFSAQEKQVESAIQNMSGMYGDLQGIVGSTTLPTLEQMDLPRLEAGATSDDAEPASQE